MSDVKNIILFLSNNGEKKATFAQYKTYSPIFPLLPELYPPEILNITVFLNESQIK